MPRPFSKTDGRNGLLEQIAMTQKQNDEVPRRKAQSRQDRKNSKCQNEVVIYVDQFFNERR